MHFLIHAFIYSLILFARNTHYFYNEEKNVLFFLLWGVGSSTAFELDVSEAQVNLQALLRVRGMNETALHDSGKTMGVRQ